MTSPPLVRPAMLVSLLALFSRCCLAAAQTPPQQLPLDVNISVWEMLAVQMLGPAMEATLASALADWKPPALAELDQLRERVEIVEQQLSALKCEMQPKPLPAKAPHDKPAFTACAKSCKQLLEQGDSPQDGVYWFTEMPVPTLCDFQLDDGGWTLLLTAATKDGWDMHNVKERKKDSPSLSDNYSILRHADAIRNLASGDKFEYRIEAQAETKKKLSSRQLSGGVWKAQRDYSFVAESNSQTDVEIVTKFGTWNYSNDGIQQRMPWLNTGSGFPLLTTSSMTQKHWWGTLVSRTTSGFAHSPWIPPNAPNSGTVLYWVRE